jgi:L-asparaginase II
MSSPALLAEVWRGDVAEIAVRGHVAVVDAAGRLLAGAGDPEALTTLRSAVKPLQALPFVESGAADALGAGDDELALACASHSGEPVHVATARRLLARAGLDESALSCGPQWPYSEEAARALVRAGEEAGSIHNNCSGKHAAMLATCRHRGWPVDGYAGREHPLQREIAAGMGELMGLELSACPWGVDGCGLPTYGVPLSALARAMARGQAERPAFGRNQAAMAAHPLLVGGTGRFDTALLSARGGSLTAKSGGAAVWAAVARPSGPAVAVKLEAGIGPQMAPVALAVLAELGLLDGALGADLREHADGEVRNWAGAPVGTTRVRVQLTSHASP